MKKKLLFVLAMLGMTSFTSLNVSAASAEIGLNVGYIDPTIGQGGPQRGPVLVPEVGIEDYTLTFSTPCYGYTLELLDEDGDVVYTTIITSTTVNLPSTLSGEYQLRLIPNDGSSIYFYGYVMF
jgi:hypothetical protein